MPRTGLGERAERRAGSCSCHESDGMGWCAGRDGDLAAPPSLGPFLSNRRGAFVCVRKPRKSPRTEARAKFHVAGVVRDRSLSRFNQVSREKSLLAHPRRCSPQPAAARRSPPQPAAARVAIGAKKNKFPVNGGVLYSARRKQRNLTRRRAMRFKYYRPPHTDARGPEAVRGAGCPMEKYIKNKAKPSLLQTL